MAASASGSRTIRSCPSSHCFEHAALKNLDLAQTASWWRTKRSSSVPTRTVTMLPNSVMLLRRWLAKFKRAIGKKIPTCYALLDARLHQQQRPHHEDAWLKGCPPSMLVRCGVCSRVSSRCGWCSKQEQCAREVLLMSLRRREEREAAITCKCIACELHVKMRN